MAVLKVEKIMGSGNLGEKIPLGAPETFFSQVQREDMEPKEAKKPFPTWKMIR